MLDFEWDEEKNAINRSKHGWDFSDAVKIFDDPFILEMEDRSLHYGELRYVATAMTSGKLITIVYTERGSKLRIISARNATAKERREYEEAHR